MVFIQISDLHVFYDERKYSGYDSSKVLEYAVNDINKNFQHVDFIIHTGDVAGSTGTEEEYCRFNNIIQGLKVPIQYIPGNLI